jgi:hypothetical protein
MPAVVVHESRAAFTRAGHRDGSYVPSLANQVGSHPLFLALLDRLKSQRQQLGATKSAPNQHRDQRVIT